MGVYATTTATANDNNNKKLIGLDKQNNNIALI